jgi:hypothetical protein
MGYMTTNTDEPLQAVGGMGNDNSSLYETIASQTRSAGDDLAKAQSDTKQPLPFQTITGPTLQSANQNPQQAPSSAEFFARGGLSNSVKQIANEVTGQNRIKVYQNAYERLLQMGEQGADLVYDDAVKTYGEDVKEWIPPKMYFFDDKGTFMPHKYAQSVYVGIQKFKENSLAKKNYQTVATIIQNAKSRQEAASNLIAAGIDPTQFEKQINAIPSEVDKSTIDVNNSKKGYYERLPKGGSSKGTSPQTEKDLVFNDAKKGLTTANNNYYKLVGMKKALMKEKTAAEKTGMADTVEYDSQLAELDSEIAVAKASVREASTVLSELARKQNTEGRQAYWKGVQKTVVEPVIAKTDAMLNDLRASGAPVPDDPQYRNNQLDSTAQKELDPVQYEEFKNQQGGGTNSSGGSGYQAPIAIPSELDTKIMNLLRSKGVPEDQLSAALAEFKSKMAQPSQE